MNPTNGIIWDVNPVLFEIGSISVRWYGLAFAIGFAVGLYIIQKMFNHENINKTWVDKGFIYVIIGTVAGARLGHVIFYDLAYYLDHPGEIIKIWHGGLASHGAAIGIVLALWIFSKRVTKKSILWILDRIVVVAAFVGCLIRLGNLMNHEIIGIPSNLPWAFVFTRVDDIPRHPAQLYESISYLIIFALLMYFYWKTDKKNEPGFLTGTFMTLIFSARFLIEFIKEDQVAFESGMALNMGQWLSIPLIIIGLFLMFRKKLIKPKAISQQPTANSQ